MKSGLDAMPLFLLDNLLNASVTLQSNHLPSEMISPHCALYKESNVN